MNCYFHIAFLVPDIDAAMDEFGGLFEVDRRPVHDVGTILGVRGREGESAVARHDRGDPMSGRSVERWIPLHLCVVVGVDVDETGGDDQARNIDVGDVSPFSNRADSDDSAGANLYVSTPGRGAGAVDDGSSSQNEVISCFRAGAVEHHYTRPSLVKPLTQCRGSSRLHSEDAP